MAPRVTMTSRVRVPDTTATRQVDDELVLLNLESGIYFGLDSTGTRMWQLIAGGAALGEARQTLLDEYEVEPARLEADLVRLVEELAARGLLRLDEEAQGR